MVNQMIGYQDPNKSLRDTNNLIEMVISMTSKKRFSLINRMNVLMVIILLPRQHGTITER
jgi:hypothetical protein